MVFQFSLVWICLFFVRVGLVRCFLFFLVWFGLAWFGKEFESYPKVVYPFKYFKYFHNMTFVSVLFCYITLMLKDKSLSSHKHTQLHNKLWVCVWICIHARTHAHTHTHTHTYVYQHISHKWKTYGERCHLLKCSRRSGAGQQMPHQEHSFRMMNVAKYTFVRKTCRVDEHH